MGDTCYMWRNTKHQERGEPFGYGYRDRDRDQEIVGSKPRQLAATLGDS